MPAEPKGREFDSLRAHHKNQFLTTQPYAPALAAMGQFGALISARLKPCPSD
jgi:hypothetical protein